MTKQSSGKPKSDDQKSTSFPQITLLDAKEFLFQVDGETVNVEDATDEQFDQFIRHHIKVGWTLEDRVDAVNFALKEGKTLAILPEKNQIAI